jgi:hypothetical protein
MIEIRFRYTQNAPVVLMKQTGVLETLQENWLLIRDT